MLRFRARGYSRRPLVPPLLLARRSSTSGTRTSRVGELAVADPASATTPTPPGRRAPVDTHASVTLTSGQTTDALSKLDLHEQRSGIPQVAKPHLFFPLFFFPLIPLSLSLSVSVYSLSRRTFCSSVFSPCRQENPVGLRSCFFVLLLSFFFFFLFMSAFFCS